MKTVIEIIIPEVPPSFNAVGGKAAGGWKWVKLKKEWENILGMEMLVHRARIPKDATRVGIAADLRFRTNRRRDVVNYRTVLDKVCGDFLQKMRLIPDDTPEFYNFDILTFSHDPASIQRTLLKFTFDSPDRT